jgi:hypothetical protein
MSKTEPTGDAPMTTLWPERNFKGLGRVLTLLILLGLAIKFSLDLPKFDPGSVFVETMTRLVGAKFLEDSARLPKTNLPRDLNDSDYGFSVLDQAKIAAACKQFIRLQGFFPSSIQQLKTVGLSPTYYQDPWHRPYLLHLFSGNLLVVQSTGKSGIDRISGAIPEPHLSPQPPVQMVGDNLVLVERLEIPDSGHGSR